MRLSRPHTAGGLLRRTRPAGHGPRRWKKNRTNFFFQKNQPSRRTCDINNIITGEPPCRGNACKRTGNRTDTDGDDAASSTAGRGLSVACATIYCYILFIFYYQRRQIILCAVTATMITITAVGEQSYRDCYYCNITI
ncbi:unnamed protein product [Aphis gossypii]|uniref:Uncharacterized protein n=1 Tax=Aphis gossypii TaxID=80765 RepID=A0A9P0JL30_APHGO|nr:unnamed protein product [Aphis gossypii]